MDRYVLVVIVGILGFIYSGANAAIAEQKIDDKIVGERIGKVIDSIKSDKFMPCSNGSFWMSLDPKHKRSFLNGFFDGVLGSEMWCKMSLENSVDYKNDMAKKFSPEMNIMDLIQSLDDEYKSNDNLYYDIYGTIISKSRTISSIPDESTLKYMKSIDPKQF